MGWWSEDIMGGDAPLDFEDEIFEICDTEKFPEEGGIGKVSAEALENNLDEILAMLERSKDYIGYQVLAVMMMGSGAFISDDVKADMIKGCDDDEWAKDDETRKEKVEALKSAITSYDGKTPVVITSKGLFETIFKHIEDGNEGLVNKNV